ncbi:uncharacterized protein LOC142239006 [Haematobia irritans]|uniref:uncharacterized protein LOC142239006 n=1 Tax=Haematobia irritans TaxID=7368 RepID=UPI003F50B1C8
MAQWKLSLVSKLLILSLCCTFAFGRLNTVFGGIGLMSDIVHISRVYIDANETEPVQTVIKKFPITGTAYSVPLSGILITDLGSPGNYGHYYLREGGPGHFNSTIEVTSDKNKNVTATITYYVITTCRTLLCEFLGKH